MSNFLKKLFNGSKPITSPSLVPGTSLNKGENHNAVDLAEEIAYRFGWKRDRNGAIRDAKGRRLIADDEVALLYLMDDKGWISGSGRMSVINWDAVKLGSSSTAIDRLLS